MSVQSKRHLWHFWGSSFSPTQISNLAMWLDGSDSSSITVDGSNNISQWNDKSGNGRHLLQTNATQRPSYTSSNQINGITVPNFDGSDDTMSTSGASTISQADTIYIVFRLGSGATNPQLYDGSSARQYLYFPTTTSIQAFANSTMTPTITSVVGAVTQVGVLFNGASSTIRMNGAQISSGNLGVSGIGPETVVGSNRFGGSPFKGTIAELLIYSKALSTTERDNAEAYLKAKWGTP